VSYLIFAPDTPEEKIYLLNPGVNTIGRDIKNSIVIPDKSLSRYHAEIICHPQETIIKDLKSLNKTVVNKLTIEQQTLQDGDLICLAQKIFLKFIGSPNLGLDKNTDYGSEPEITFVKQLAPAQSINFLENLVKTEHQVPGSILNIEAEDSQQRSVEKLKILLEISKQLCTPEEPEKLLVKIVEFIFQIMAIARAAILLVNPETQLLEPKAIKLQQNLETNQNFYSKRIVNWVRKNGTGLISADSRSDERFTGSNSIMEQKIHASMCVPLKPQQEVIGVIYVDNLSISSAYSDEDLDFLTALANQAAVIIHLSQEYYKKEQQLKQQVLELQIQIDEVRRNQEVEEIVNADFFKNLQLKAKNFKKTE